MSAAMAGPLAEPARDRVAIVTGAGQGIGRAEALELARQGACVVVNDLRGAAETVEEIRGWGGVALADAHDVSTWAGARGVVDAALAAFGDLHVLVNNAGVVADRMSFRLSEREWDHVLDVDLKGHIGPARFAAAYWREQHRGGVRMSRHVVNTTSESGLYGSIGQLNYAAAKAGVAAATLVLAGELARYGVVVNAVAPRARTGMSDEAFAALPADAAYRHWSPDHVARVVAWLCSAAATDVTGQVLTVFGGTVQLLTGWSVARTAHAGRGWDDENLRGLREQLFPDGAGQRAPFHVHTLFTAPDAPVH